MELKILIAVMSCNVEDYPQLIDTQKNTWDSIKHSQVQTIYYYAGYNTELIGNRLMIDCEEGTGYFYIKTIKAFKYLLQLEWDYLVKTDNSAYINKHELVQKLQNKPRQSFFGGHLYQVPNSASFLWGEGMILSRDVIEFLVKEYEESNMLRSGVEDVHIGMILKDKFPWDTSFTIHSFYPREHFIRTHIHRCKNDQPNAIKFQDDIRAMLKIHNFYLEQDN